MTIRRGLLLLILSCLFGAVLAQDAGLGPLPDSVRENLRQGEAAMQEALATYDAHYPDRPLWQEAFRYGRAAQRLAPERPEPLRFLAEAYSRSNWIGPAWNAWQDYLARGFTLDSEATPLFADVGERLAYNYYEQGDKERALRTYRSIIDEVPFDLEAYVWAGRILLELEEPEQAISYWETVVERDPTDRRAEYFLGLARDQARWGVGAVNAFREGVTFYEQGELVQARERFARATSLNPRYPEAWTWLGRVAFERGNYQDARTYYGRATDLEPANQTYAYFYAEAGRRAAPAEETTD